MKAAEPVIFIYLHRRHTTKQLAPGSD